VNCNQEKYVVVLYYMGSICRQVVARFSINENITAVVDGFANYFEIDDVSAYDEIVDVKSKMTDVLILFCVEH
jgi:hypothetical protein